MIHINTYSNDIVKIELRNILYGKDVNDKH